MYMVTRQSAGRPNRSVIVYGIALMKPDSAMSVPAPSNANHAKDHL
jgi:hypothetical protein